MKSFRIPILSAISGAIGKVLGSDDHAIVARADGLYRAHKVLGVLTEHKIFDESHEEEIKGMATGLGNNTGVIRNVLYPGDTIKAEEMESFSSAIPTSASITGTTSISPVENFEALRDNLNNGKISFKVNSIEHYNIALSLENQKFPEQEIVNHVSYASSSSASLKRGMTVQVPVTGKDQSIINKLSIYLAAGETYSIKIYNGDSEVELVHSESISAAYTKFYEIEFDDHILNNNDKITVIVEGDSFNYYYPEATANFTDSWSDAGKDGVFNIQNTLPIKLYAMPAITIVSGDISSLAPFIKQSIESATGLIATVTYTDKFNILFDPGYLEFDIMPSESVDIATMFGFTSGKVTVYGTGYSAESAAGRLIRADEFGGIPEGFLEVQEKTAAGTYAMPDGTNKVICTYHGQGTGDRVKGECTLTRGKTTGSIVASAYNTINVGALFTADFTAKTLTISADGQDGIGSPVSMKLYFYRW